MVVVLKKLTSGALLSPLEAPEEFRLGIIRCFGALLLCLHPCTDDLCPCKQIDGLPMLLARKDLVAKFASEPQQCLLAFLQSESASAAVGHWLSLLLKVFPPPLVKLIFIVVLSSLYFVHLILVLLCIMSSKIGLLLGMKAADVEAARGHRGSATLRVEAFKTLRVLIAKVLCTVFLSVAKDSFSHFTGFNAEKSRYPGEVHGNSTFRFLLHSLLVPSIVECLS